jgi:hypothetical protein
MSSQLTSTVKTYDDPPSRPPFLNDLAFLISLLNCWTLVNPFFLLHAKQHRLAFVEEEFCAVGVPDPDVLGVGKG